MGTETTALCRRVRTGAVLDFLDVTSQGSEYIKSPDEYIYEPF